MKNYGKLINGKLEYAPRNFETIDGLIVNFNQDEKIMKYYGFKLIKDNYPNIEENQYYVFDKYIEDETSITINYKVIDDTPIDSEMDIDPMDARLTAVETDVIEIKTQQAELQTLLIQERNK